MREVTVFRSCGNINSAELKTGDFRLSGEFSLIAGAAQHRRAGKTTRNPFGARPEAPLSNS
jgi:hypothetical protein